MVWLVVGITIYVGVSYAGFFWASYMDVKYNGQKFDITPAHIFAPLFFPLLFFHLSINAPSLAQRRKLIQDAQSQMEKPLPPEPEPPKQRSIDDDWSPSAK